MSIYAKIENGVVVDYPVWEGSVSKEFTQYKFPLELPENIKVNGGIPNLGNYVPVNITPFPEETPRKDFSKRYIDGAYFDSNTNICTQTWSPVYLTDDEKKFSLRGTSRDVRVYRDIMLEISDKSVVADKWENYSEQEKKEWSEYRQSLRDITLQNDFPWIIDWPIEPSLFEIKKF